MPHLWELSDQNGLFPPEVDATTELPMSRVSKRRREL